MRCSWLSLSLQLWVPGGEGGSCPWGGCPNEGDLRRPKLAASFLCMRMNQETAVYRPWSMGLSWDRTRG